MLHSRAQGVIYLNCSISTPENSTISATGYMYVYYVFIYIHNILYICIYIYIYVCCRHMQYYDDKVICFFCRSNFNHGMWQLSSMECDDTFCTNHPLNMTTLALPWTSQWFEVSQCLFLKKQTKRPIRWLCCFCWWDWYPGSHWLNVWVEFNGLSICFNSLALESPGHPLKRGCPAGPRPTFGTRWCFASLSETQRMHGLLVSIR